MIKNLKSGSFRNEPTRKYTSVVVGFKDGAAEPESSSDQTDFEGKEKSHRNHL
jgi:hypothetical protein